MNHIEKLRKVWLAATSAEREDLRIRWSELGDALDAVAWRPEDEQISAYAKVDSAFKLRKQAETPGTALHEAMEKFNEQQRAEMAARPIAPKTSQRCRATHASKAWPFVGRCVLVKEHDFPYDHKDQHGEEFRNEPCDGCKNIQRMADNLVPGDETTHYEFGRAARHHRKECPNR